MSNPAIMTEALVSQICKDKGFYRSPSLNEKLYLHFTGFLKIQNIENFCNCKALWLENNSISTIENLEPLRELKTIFLQNNQINSFLGAAEACIANPEETPQLASMYPRGLRPTSGPLPSITNINLSSNGLLSLDGISFIFPNAESLIVSQNRLTNISAELKSLVRLCVFDISHNQIDIDASPVESQSIPIYEGSLLNFETEAEREILCVATHPPQISTVIFVGNPFVKKIKHYRKKLISMSSSIKAIDDEPVFNSEREASEAYSMGGRNAERQAREKLRAHTQEVGRQNMKRFDEMISVAEDDTMEDVFITGVGI